MDLQLNRVIKDFEGIEITIFMRQHRLSCYVTQTFDGDQRLELIVYRNIGVTTDFVEFWHEVHDGINGSGNVCKIMCEVDIGCDSISLLRWKSILNIVL